MSPQYEIVPERPDQIPDVIVKMRALGGEFSGMVRGLVAEAVKEGKRVAEMEVPVGPEQFHTGSRIKDAIQSFTSPYKPGGAGGGGTFEGRIWVDNELAPQVDFVMQGTMDDGTEKIKPAKGNVLAIEKDGEGVHYRAWAHGQRPNTSWWEHAFDEAEHILSTGLERPIPDR